MNASPSGGIFNGARFNRPNLPVTAEMVARKTRTPMKQAIAIWALKPSFLSDAATISGDGVSPAASAAAIGSPPGSAIATFSADDGRRFGSSSRHLRIKRSTAGSRSLTRSVGLVCVPVRRLPVNISYKTRPSEYKSLRVVTSLPAFCSGDM